MTKVPRLLLTSTHIDLISSYIFQDLIYDPFFGGHSGLVSQEGPPVLSLFISSQTTGYTVYISLSFFTVYKLHITWNLS